MAITMCTATLLADPMTASSADVRAAGDAALAAGFNGASVWAHHLRALDGVELPVTVVEAAMGWANGDSSTAAAEAAHLASIVAETGAAKLVAVCLEPTIADFDIAQANLATLVAAIEGVGAQVCVEFLPWTGIADLATAWSLVEPLGDAAGILLDTWHWVRQPGGPALELLNLIPGIRIGYLQLCDAAAVPGTDLMTEAMTNRLLPGHGVIEFASIFAALDSIGADPIVATEIFNPELIATMGASGAAIAMKSAAGSVGAD